MVDNCLEYNSTSDTNQSITEDQRKEAKWYCVYGNEFRRKWKETVCPTLKFLTMNRDSHVAGMRVSKQYNKQTSTLQAAIDKKRSGTTVSALRTINRTRSTIKKGNVPNARKRVRSNSSTTMKSPRKRLNIGHRCQTLDSPEETRTSSTSPIKIECNPVGRIVLSSPKVKLQLKF
jgi:hypothetical protein